MLILAGQGNPGPAYAGNRHNIGFRAVDAIAARWGFGPERSRFQGLAREGTIDTPGGPVKVLTLRPQTFYNESGRSVAAALKFYKLTPADLVLFYDEIDLAAGRFRMKTGGGAAGNLLAAGEDERYQAEVMRLAPAEKLEPRRSGDPA